MLGETRDTSQMVWHKSGERGLRDVMILGLELQGTNLPVPADGLEPRSTARPNLSVSFSVSARRHMRPFSFIGYIVSITVRSSSINHTFHIPRSCAGRFNYRPSNALSAPVLNALYPLGSTPPAHWRVVRTQIYSPSTFCPGMRRLISIN